MKTYTFLDAVAMPPGSTVGKATVEEFRIEKEKPPVDPKKLKGKPVLASRSYHLRRLDRITPKNWD